MSTHKNYKKAGFWIRFAAFVVDYFVVLLFSTGMSTLLELGAFPSALDQILRLAVIAATLLYAPFFIAKFGATIGKQLLRLRVVTTSYAAVGFWRAVLRETFGKFLSSIVVNIGFLVPLINPQKQAWHDMLAHTYVVRVDAKGKMIPSQKDVVTKSEKVTFWVFLTLILLFLALPFIFLFTYLFAFQPHKIAGQSMAPNYVQGQYYVSDKRAYQQSNPERGDVIVFKYPPKPEYDYISRIVGLPGDTVALVDGKVSINGTILDEPYLASGTVTSAGGFLKQGQSVVVPQGHYFALGDNREHSSDSRMWGFVPKENFVGKVAFCYFACDLSRKSE